MSVRMDQRWGSKVKRKNFIRSDNRYIPYMHVSFLPAYAHRPSIRILRIKAASAALAALPFCRNPHSSRHSLIYFFDVYSPYDKIFLRIGGARRVQQTHSSLHAAAL